MSKFGGYGGGGFNIQQMMKQAQRMQEQMQKAQEELEEIEVTGSSGGGIVNIVLNGKKKLMSVSISKEAIDPDDPEMLEDLLMAAYNDAYNKADEKEKELLPPGIPSI